jgi:hypothetical protein
MIISLAFFSAASTEDAPDCQLTADGVTGTCTVSVVGTLRIGADDACTVGTDAEQATISGLFASSLLTIEEAATIYICGVSFTNVTLAVLLPNLATVTEDLTISNNGM